MCVCMCVCTCVCICICVCATWADHPPKQQTNQTNQENKLKARVYKERLKYAVDALPSPLEFFGYVYCFTTFLAGPGTLCV